MAYSKAKLKSSGDTSEIKSILNYVLYGFETWFLTLREEYILRVFENRVLKRIFGLKRDEVTGGGGGNCLTRNFVIVLFIKDN
jgi:hypothetical protein